MREIRPSSQLGVLKAGKGAMVELGICLDMELCPVSALWRYLGARGGHNGFLFVHGDGNSLTAHQFWMATAYALAQLGLSGMRFGTHSFQIGAASSSDGVPPCQDSEFG